MHYSNSTKATFQALNNFKLETFLIKKCKDFCKNGKEIENEFCFMNKNYTFDFNSKNRSFYFIENEKKLIRISDHWSEIIGDKKIKEVGSIRSCFWKLSQKNGFAKKHLLEIEFWWWGEKPVMVMIGFCMLDSFKKI